MKHNLLINTALIALTMLMITPIAYAASGNSQLGVTLQDLDHNLREHFNYMDNGVLITGIIEGTGAEKAGLSENDILTEINGRKVAHIQDVRNILGPMKPGESIHIKIFRDGSDKSMQVDLSEKKQPENFYPWKLIHYIGDRRPWIGIKIQDLNAQLAEYFKVKSGILITEVVKDSPAEKAELAAGDVVTRWNEKEIKNTADFYKRLGNSNPQDEVQLKFFRKGKQKKAKVILAEPRREDDRLYSFYIDRDNADDFVFRFQRPGPGNPWPQNFPFPRFQSLVKYDLDPNVLMLRLDELEKEIKMLKKKLDQLEDKIDK